MKKFLSFLSVVLYLTATAQTKEDLINKIVNYNIFESDCIGIFCGPSEQYNAFQKLISMISQNELIELSKHKEPVIRAYASQELIKNNIEVLNLFLFEIDKNETVETQDGCVGGFDNLSWLVYNMYKGKIASQSITKLDNDDNIRKLKLDKALAKDKTFQKLDSIILSSDKDLYYMFYYVIFKDKKVNEKFDIRIRELAFKNNNFYAFDYISTKYPHEAEFYLKSDFIHADFNSENKVHYLEKFIEYLLDLDKEKYTEIVIHKLKKDQYWKNYFNFIDEKLRKRSIVL